MEKLIEAIKENPIIWDKHHENFYKTKLRRMTYEKIAREMNMNSGDCVKNAWGRLRRNYSRHLERAEERNFPYKKEMSFLKDIIKEKKEESDDDLEEFFCEVYKETKKMPPGIQDFVKMKIKNIMSEARERETPDTEETPPRALVEFINTFNPYS